LHLSTCEYDRLQLFENCTKDIMSDAHNEHESAIRTPKQLFAAVAGFFLVTVIGIILLVQFVTTTRLTGAGTNSQGAAAMAERLRPVAEQGFVLRDANAPKVLLAGEAVYTGNCVSCHGAGMAGAPKFGDAAAWSARIAQGYDVLVKHALEGIRAMPAKGGNPDLDPVEIARAVVYMANQGGAKFQEPSVPAMVVATPAPAEAAAPEAAAPAAVAPAAAPAAEPVKAAACHTAGIAGAPKFADKAVWAPRIKQGAPVLYEHALKGFAGKAGMMPAKGGSAASDDEVKAAVDYMVSSAK
jgi:cytochrome c5